MMELFVFQNQYPEYEVLKHICPRMQNYCKKLIETIPQGIEKIILFGSALTTACTTMSDLDMIIILKDKEAKVALHHFLATIEVEIDAIVIEKEESQSFFEENRNLSYAIKNRSVILYES